MSRTFLTVVLACIFASAGCFTQAEWQRFWASRDKGSQPEPSPHLVSSSKATRGTVGELVTVDGLRLLQVRGFGLVVDLAGSGGSDGPDVVRKYLIKEIRRWQKPGDTDVPADDLLTSRDTTMVEVTGLIPAGTKKGDPFDVVLRALGTETKSLSGGRLVLCNLKLYAETIDAVLGGKTLATASGPVFISPIGLRQEIPEKINLRSGLVLGGGMVKRARNLRLVLNDPSPSIARRIVNRLNGRFATGDPIAVGQSHTTVELIIPQAYHGRKVLFLEHLLHTTLNSDPAWLRQRAGALAEEIKHPDAEFESIGVAWEAIGRIALPQIRPLYHHKLPATNYIAGRAGLRLGDNPGMEAVARHAKDPTSPFRNQAIKELGYAVKMHGAGEELRKLLSDPDDEVRLRAYKALRRRPHPAIESEILYKDNLVLDIVDSGGAYLVYFQRSAAPRIAIFGRHMRCRTPAVYPGDRRDDRFLHTQISALPGDRELTLIFRNKRTGRTSPKLSAPLVVTELIRFLGDAPDEGENGALEALGVPYDEIADILYTFCDQGTIPAEFVAEDLTGADAAGPESQRERTESEY